MNSLPAECIQRIATFLPCSTVLQFLLVSRYIKAACDDWQVYYNVIKNDPDFLDEVVNNSSETRDVYKKLVIASIIAARHSLPGNFAGWLPQLLACHRRIISPLNSGFLLTSEPDRAMAMVDPFVFYKASEPKGIATGTQLPNLVVYDSPPRTRADREQYEDNPRLPFDVQKWREAQSGAFCLAIAFLGSPIPPGQQWAPPRPLLRDVEWFRINPNVASYQPTELEKMHAALHTFANKAVANFAVEIRAAIAEDRIWAVRQNSYPLPTPPTALDIPFRSLMSLPEPMTPNVVDSFSSCHLPVMARPDFFIQGEWTGYRSFVGELGAESWNPNGGPACDKFDAIGADNDNVRICGWDQPDSGYPIPDRTIRFHFIRWREDGKFVVRSNAFQSAFMTNVFMVTVDCQTGLLEVEAKDHRGYRHGLRLGVITPFGIVISENPGSVWFWFWKTEWAGSF